MQNSVHSRHSFARLPGLATAFVVLPCVSGTLLLQPLLLKFVPSPGTLFAGCEHGILAQDETSSSRLQKPCLGGQGDLVSRLIMGINGLTIWVVGAVNLLTKSP